MLKLEVKNLSCTRGSKNLFRNLSFKLIEGECLLIKGQNGSGKSSLLKILAGLCSSQKGKIHWSNPLYTSLSYLGHKDGLRQSLTPYENILSRLKISSVTKDLTEIDQVFNNFQISTIARLPCTALSAGQNRKVSLASIVLSQKQIWILDEPFSSLDKKSSDRLTQFMRQHLQNKGMIILASHFFEIDLPHQIIDLGE